MQSPLIVIITYLEGNAEAQNIVRQIENMGAKALAVKVDVGIEADVLNLFDRIDNEFGRVDALVNNAGILRKKLFNEIKVAELEKLFSVNVIGSFICAREAFKRMAKS